MDRERFDFARMIASKIADDVAASAYSIRGHAPIHRRDMRES